MKEIVFPNKNESEFIEIGNKLHLEGFIFVYDFNYFMTNRPETHMSSEIGLLVNSKNIQKAKNYSKNLFVVAEEENRMYFDDKSRKTIFGLELSQREDFMHQRNSGLNQVLCKLATKNEITIGLSFSSVLHSQGRERARLIGRMMQNIRLCRKYKTEVIISSFTKRTEDVRNPEDVKSFLRVISQK